MGKGEMVEENIKEVLVRKVLVIRRVVELYRGKKN